MYNSGQIHNTNLSTTIYNLYYYPHSKIDTIPLLRTYYLPFCTILSIFSLLLLCTGTTIINANSFDPIKAKKSTYPDVHSKTGVLVVVGSSLPFWDFWVLLVCSTTIILGLSPDHQADEYVTIKRVVLQPLFGGHTSSIGLLWEREKLRMYFFFPDSQHK